MNVELFIPCCVDQYFPEIGFLTIDLLEKSGCRVNYNPNQTCCGKPAFMAGLTKESREVAEKFLRDFSEKDYIVTPSGSCSAFVQKYFGEMFENAALHNDYKSVSRNIYELSDFLVEKMGVTTFDAYLEGIAVLLNPCNCGAESNQNIMTLLENVEGLVVSEFNDDLCCGFGDYFSLHQPELSKTLARRKLETALDKSADIIICNDMSCLMHLKSCIDEESFPLKVMHIAEVLNARKDVSAI